MGKKIDMECKNNVVVSCSNCGSAYCIGCRKTCPICHFDTRDTSVQVYPRKDMENGNSE